MQKVKKFSTLVIVFLFLQLFVRGCMGLAKSDYGMIDYQFTYYECFQGAPKETEDSWSEICLTRSVSELPAPLFSAVWPIEYQVLAEKEARPQDPTETKLYWGTYASVSQMLPVGKKIEVFTWLEKVWIDGVCVFLDKEGQALSIGEDCQHPKQWRPGTAGFDGRTSTLLAVQEIIRQEGFNLAHSTQYDSLGRWSFRTFYRAGE